MTPSRLFAAEMKPIIDEKFNLLSDDTESFDGFKPDQNTYYQYLRKSVLGRYQAGERLVEIHICRYRSISADRMIKEDVWVYEDGMNRDLETGKLCGFRVGNLRFQDYKKNICKREDGLFR